MTHIVKEVFVHKAHPYLKPAGEEVKVGLHLGAPHPPFPSHAPVGPLSDAAFTSTISVRKFGHLFIFWRLQILRVIMCINGDITRYER